ncbi:bifunctional [glutamate--ammonia ligase]-adenylyl-L-tyrosine phosphorylase/[glutamate--ammonia-ligase] adenylyltransferase [Celerinatantimonas sp. YJH-8]|uniref:bifunctional [glutamate--ammonia ligase]-adenylyl-L-tyrosine phosphorylase/[glutamate--ammonia-ligase] adenylyltransferase n=1 Tax=Celerinatantimonas sp. YJH-8 TaxID=3228714 RepID=UPI0038C252B4
MDELIPLAEKRWQQLCQVYPALEQYQGQKAFIGLNLALSDFIFEQSLQYPQWLEELLTPSKTSLPNLLNAEAWHTALTGLNDAQVKQWLRLRRNRIMLEIAWLELGQKIDIRQSMFWVSQLADTAISCALAWLTEKERPTYGIAYDHQGNPVSLTVLAMGKLGGQELNFSSDIDLIFCYRDNGETQGGRRSLANQQYFIRLGQQLIQLLSQVTADGFVFRVDMRLRPFGESGPLAVSFNAIEDYYQNHGRDWERYAMVKVRPIQADPEDVQRLQSLLTPFVYRRYIDFSVLESLRQMKAMIRAEVRRKNLSGNIKLGQGGIREIEFIVQALQLIRGGRLPMLQQTSLLTALAVFDEQHLLDSEQIQQLQCDYLFLRQVENILQELKDRQTQQLPQDTLNQQRLAYVLGDSDWKDCLLRIQQVLENVSDQFDAVIGDEDNSLPPVEVSYQLLWQNLTQGMGLLESSVFSEDFCRQLISFEQVSKRRIVGAKGRETLDRLMPVFLQMIAAHAQSDILAPRLFALLEAILSRSAYLQLLLENSGALQQLFRLCEASALVAEKLQMYPMLLDELLDPQILYQPVSESSYQAQLNTFMLRIEPDDLEQQMEALRQFKQIQILHIAASDIVGALPVMKVSDHLTVLAEAITGKVVQLAWQQMVQRYGYPQGIASEQSETGFAVIGYGKLGGIELGYGSDLDLVFMHNCESYAPTTGPKQIDSKQFYLRLAQRIMHLFQARTASGILYEVDMRLRPSGQAGLLVTSVDAFEAYQQQKAWTWEHQALVRARVIYGDAELQQRFSRIRHQILATVRDVNLLRQDVVTMRDKMQAHLDRSNDSQVDLKQSRGGMVDIEFIAQFLVLAYGYQFESLTQWSDNVRIFEQAHQAGLLSESEQHQLTQTYLDIRNQSHRLALQCHSRLMDRSQLQGLNDELAAVANLWAHWLCP